VSASLWALFHYYVKSTTEFYRILDSVHTAVHIPRPFTGITLLLAIALQAFDCSMQNSIELYHGTIPFDLIHFRRYQYCVSE